MRQENNNTAQEKNGAAGKKKQFMSKPVSLYVHL